MKKIKLYYHDGFYNLKDPASIVKNLFRHGKIHTPVYNIGDQISPVVVSALSGRKVVHAQPFMRNKLIAIGSVLAGIKSGDTAWGSGLMKPEHVKFVATEKNIDIVAVRGPLTYETLIENGVECAKVFGDPGILMPDIFFPKVEKKYRLGVIPHITQVRDFLTQVDKTSTVVISPRLHWRKFISQLLECEVIISSSLHGVILAEAYGVPTVPMKHGDFLHGTPFKFQDYFLSTDRECIFCDSKDALNMGKVAELIGQVERPKIDKERLVDAFPYLDDRESPVSRAAKLA